MGDTDEVLYEDPDAPDSLMGSQPQYTTELGEIRKNFPDTNFDEVLLIKT